MARIVLGLGSSHSPQLSIPPEYWRERGEEDRRNPWLYSIPDGKHVSFDELLETADPPIAKELTPEVFERRHAANQRGIARVAEALERTAPDVLLMVGELRLRPHPQRKADPRRTDPAEHLLSTEPAHAAALPRPRLQSGTSEIRNWITVAGAAQHLDMELFDYVPCYRSPAGTGCAMAFAQWI